MNSLDSSFKNTFIYQTNSDDHVEFTKVLLVAFELPKPLFDHECFK